MPPGDQRPIERQAGKHTSSEREGTVCECRECGNIAIAFDGTETLTCHGEPMQPATEVPLTASQSDVSAVFHEVFDVPKPASEICTRVFTCGPTSTGELADAFDYDRSTVTMYLNRLVDAGLLERTRLNREGGGFVNVYYVQDADTLKRDVQVALHHWVAGVVSTFAQSVPGAEDRSTNSGADTPSGPFWDE